MIEVFSVECEFAHVWAKYAPPEYFQIYIYLVCCSSQKNSTLQPEEVAVVLGKNKRKVEAAFEFWVQVGLIEKSQDGVYYLIDKTRTDVVVPSAQTQLGKPPYSSVEITDAMNRNRKVCELFKTCEMLLGKPLSHAHTQLIYSIYDWLGFEIEAIFVLFTYAAERGKGTARWLEKTAMDWADKGIKTCKAAEAHVKYLEKYSKSNSLEIDKSLSEAKKIVRRPVSAGRCKFNNFSGRHDYDYDYIEKKAVNDMLEKE